MTGEASDIFGGIGNAVGGAANWVGNEVGSIGSDIGGLFTGGGGSSGPTGQPVSGSPGASPASITAPSAALPSVSGGGSGSPFSAAGFSAGPGGATSPTPYGIDPSSYGGALTPIDPSVIPMLSLPGGDAGATGGATDPTGGSGSLGAKATGAATGATANQHPILRDLIGAAPIGISLLNNKTPAAEKQLQALAAQAQTDLTANQNLSSAALNGNIPGGAMAAIEQAEKAAEATIRSNYASMGLSGSSQEAQAIAQAKTQSVEQRFQIAQQIAQTGLGEVSKDMTLSDDLYNQILAADTARGTALGNSIANFVKVAAV